MNEGVELGIDLGTTNSSLAAVSPPETEPKSARVSRNDQPYDTILRTRVTVLAEGSGLERVRGVGDALDPNSPPRHLSEFKPYFREPWLRRRIRQDFEVVKINSANDIPNTSAGFRWVESTEPYSWDELVLGAAGIFRHLFSKLNPRVRPDDVARIYLGLPFNTWSLSRRRLLASVVDSGLVGDHLQALEKVRFIPEAVGASSTVPLVARRKMTEATVLVFDFGGGTLDLAVLRYKGDAGTHMLPTELLATGGLAFAGSHIDHMIQQRIIEREGLSQELTGKTREEFLEAAQSLKIQLSKATEAVEVFGTAGSYTLTLAELDGLLTERMAQIRSVVTKVLQRAAVRPKDINLVYTAGGSSLLPQVQTLLNDLFGEDNDNLYLHDAADEQPGGSCEKALTAVCRGLTLSGLRSRLSQKADRSYLVLTADGELVELLKEGTSFDPESGVARGTCVARNLPSAGDVCTVALYERHLGEYQHVLNFTGIPNPRDSSGLRLHLELGVSDAFPRLVAEYLASGAKVPVRNVQDLKEAEVRQLIRTESSTVPSSSRPSPVPPSRPIRNGDRLTWDGGAYGTVTNIRDLECRGTAPCLSQTQHPDLSRYGFTVRNGNNEMKLHKFAHEIRLVDPEEGAPKG